MKKRLALLLAVAFAALVSLSASQGLGGKIGVPVAKASSTDPGTGGPSCWEKSQGWSYSGTNTAGGNYTFKGFSTAICNVDNVTVTGTMCFQQKVYLGGTITWQDAYGCAVIPGTSPAHLATAYSSTVSMLVSKKCDEPTYTTQSYRLQIHWTFDFADSTPNLILLDTIGPRGDTCEMNLFGP